VRFKGVVEQMEYYKGLIRDELSILQATMFRNIAEANELERTSAEKERQHAEKIRSKMEELTVQTKEITQVLVKRQFGECAITPVRMYTSY
jgi:hypothetical protein